MKPCRSFKAELNGGYMDSKQVDSRIRRALDSVRRAFRGAVAQVDSGAAVQRIQIEGLAGETVQALEHGEPWGLTANPPAGCDCFVLPLGGATSHGVVIAVAGGGARVIGLKSGEVAYTARTAAPSCCVRAMWSRLPRRQSKSAAMWRSAVM